MPVLTGMEYIRINTWPSEIVLVRHGESEHNVQKREARACGRENAWTDNIRDPDTALTEVGALQATAVGQHLDSWPEFNVVHSSPYRRALETTHLILNELDYTPELFADERLREIEFGILDGLTRQGILARFPGEAERRAAIGKYWYRPPGGESRPDVNLRIGFFINDLRRDYAGQRVLIVAHSVVLLAFRGEIEGWDEKQYLLVDDTDEPKNAGITRYVQKDHRMLLRDYNQTVTPHG